MNRLDVPNLGGVAPAEAGAPAQAPVVPPHLLEAAGSAIQLAMEAFDRKVVPMGLLVGLAFDGADVSRGDFSFFKQAVKGDPRLSQYGHGQYVVRARISEAEEAELESVVEEDINNHLTLVADRIAFSLFEYSNRQLNNGQVLGIAKTITGFLTTEEKHDLFGLLATHPSVDPLENGRFAARPATDFVPRAENFFDTRYASVEIEPARNKDQAMSPTQLKKAVQSLQYSAQSLQARADRGRRASPKRLSHKHAPNQQGRYHGKKLNLEALLAQAS